MQCDATMQAAVYFTTFDSMGPVYFKYVTMKYITFIISGRKNILKKTPQGTKPGSLKQIICLSEKLLLETILNWVVT